MITNHRTYHTLLAFATRPSARHGCSGGSESIINLIITTFRSIESPGAALVELVHALTDAKRCLRTEGRVTP